MRSVSSDEVYLFSFSIEIDTQVIDPLVIIQNKLINKISDNDNSKIVLDTLKRSL